MEKFADQLKTDCLQFGYKKESSTSLAALTVKEVGLHYVHNGSAVHACFLDASKAFDRVQFTVLKACLVRRNISPRHINLLMNMYYKQHSVVRWDGSDSNDFTVNFGVRQGGVASAVLFSIYVDELFVLLRTSGFGCHMGSVFCGAIGYADDIALLAPTRTCLQKMIDLTQSFLENRSLKLNGAKSVYLVFQKNQRLVTDFTIKVTGENIRPSCDVKYLGHIISANLVDKPDILRIRLNIIRTGFQISQAMAGCSMESKMRVFSSKVVHLYGCCTWKFNEDSFKNIEVAWRKVLKCSSQLPVRTRTSILHSLTESDPLCDIIHKRNTKFIGSLESQTNSLIVTLFQYAKSDSRSIIGNNIHALQSYAPKNFKETVDSDSVFEIWNILINPFCMNTVPGFSKRELFSILQAMVT